MTDGKNRVPQHDTIFIPEEQAREQIARSEAIGRAIEEELMKDIRADVAEAAEFGDPYAVLAFHPCGVRLLSILAEIDAQQTSRRDVASEDLSYIRKP